MLTENTKAGIEWFARVMGVVLIIAVVVVIFSTDANTKKTNALIISHDVIFKRTAKRLDQIEAKIEQLHKNANERQ